MTETRVSLLLIGILTVAMGLFTLRPDSPPTTVEYCPPIGPCPSGIQTDVEGAELVARYTHPGAHNYLPETSSANSEGILLYLDRSVGMDCTAIRYTVQPGDTIRITSKRENVHPHACDSAPAYLFDVVRVPSSRGVYVITWDTEVPRSEHRAIR